MRGWSTGGNLLMSATSHPNVSGDDSGSAQAGGVAVVVHQPQSAFAPPPALLHLAHLAQQSATAAAPPPAAQQHTPRHRDRPPREYTCKECGKSYATNQALGGHVAGHKMRQRDAAAAAGMMALAPGQEDGAAAEALLAALRRGRGAEAPHECRKCGKVFPTGVALGGHMRVHYTGPPIVPTRKNKIKRCLLALAVHDVGDDAPPPPGLSLALSIKTEEDALPSMIKTEEAAPARVVRLFGIDISPQKPAAPSEQQCYESTTENLSSAAGAQQ